MDCARRRIRHKRHYGQPKVGQKRRSRKYRFDTEMVCPVVTRAAEKKNGTRSSVESAPFCPRVFLLSVHPSGRWMVGAVGIEFWSIISKPLYCQHFNYTHPKAHRCQIEVND